MKKANLMKTILLLWALIAGGGITHAAVYEWVKVNDLSEVNTGDQVLLVDVDKKIALSSEHGSQTGMVFSTPVTISDDRIANATEKNRWTLTMPYDEYENKSYYSFEGQCESGYEGQQGGKLYGVFENGEHFYDVSYANTDPYTYTTYFDFIDYGSNGGKLYYTHSGYDYYLKFEKRGNGYRAYANPDKNSGSNITLFKRVKLTFVKWKRVQNPADLATGDTTVIVDLTSSNAMKNNPADDESPAAMSVTLKEELDRLTSGVGDTITWTVDRSDAKYQFYRKDENNNTKYLRNSNKTLRVGYIQYKSERQFSFDREMLQMNVQVNEHTDSSFHVGVKQASGFMAFMGGSTWEMMEDTKDNQIQSDIAATKTAFFRKVRTDKPDPTLRFPGHDYEADVQNASAFESPTATAEAGAGTITYWSSNDEVATVDASGKVTLKMRGTVRIYAQVDATADYDDYLTSYILRIDDSEAPGGRNHPFSVADAKAYAKDEANQEEIARGTCYFVKGIVSSVGGMMAGMEDMEDMMGMFSGMMEGMGSSTGGFDMSAMLSMFMGEQEEGTVTYAISDNGVDRDSLSVINGRGLKLADITADSLSVGDWVTVYGPLEYSEDQDMMSMFSGLGIGTGGNNNQNENQEDKRTVKMPRVNYMQEHTRNLITETVILYYGETKQADELFTITDKFGGTLVTPTNADNKKYPMTSLKLSDTDFAEWVHSSETDSVLVPKMEGIITVTVNAPVLLKKPTTENEKGDTVKMKRKFYLDVRDRRVLPAGAMEGVYELVTNANQLKADDKLLIVATIDDKPKVLNRKVGGSGGSGIMSMFGGSSNASNITIGEDGKITQVPDDAMILNLEQTNGKWQLQTGRTADYKMTYLYISDTGGSGFGGGSIPGMGGGAKLKTGKLENISDSCQVTFTFPAGKNDSVQIKFNFADREKDGNTTVAKNVIRYGKSMMSSSFGGYEAESTKATLPRLYRLVHPSTFDVTIDESGWSTIVPYTDVKMPDGLEAFIVAKVDDTGEKKAVISHVTSLKGNEPYLLHSTNGSGTFTLTVSEDGAASARGNKLKISDETAEKFYVLANTNSDGGFNLKENEIIAAGYVYLPYELGAGQAYIPFEVNDNPFGIATGINEVNGKGTASDKAYDLQGRRVSVTKGQVKKGLYIVNGKKIVVK